MSNSFIKFGEVASKDYVNRVGKDLVKLAGASGPTRCIARMDNNDPRISSAESFPITYVVSEILQKINEDNNLDLVLRETNGNLLIVGGLGKNPTDQEIYNIPVTLSAHLDEITYMVKKEVDIASGLRVLMPLCKPPGKIKPENNVVKVVGFRGRDHRTLTELGLGTIQIAGEGEKRRYLLKSDAKDIQVGDLVIQYYFHNPSKKEYDLNSIIHMKALDDRVGSIALIYTIAELSKRGFPAKGILAGDEEGFNKDVSWARLVRPTFRKYSQPNGLIIVCDGFDGYWMETEFERGRYLSEALITAYVSNASGAGDPGIFSLFRDEIVEMARRCGFEAELTTCYASRSIDPKIMDEFPLIGFINWSNGRVGKSEAVCHFDESVMMRQIINIIGVTCLAVYYFTKRLQVKH